MTSANVLRLGLFVLLGAGAAAPAPLPDASGAPTAAPAAGTLPVIGRTASVRPSCVLLRDLVLPALQAAIDTDRNHKALVQHYRDYQTAQDTRMMIGDANKRMAVVRLEHDQTVLQNDLAVISRSLGDARVSAEQTDPEVRALRGALMDLEDSVRTQLANVGDVTAKANFQAMFDDDESLSHMKGSMNGPRPTAIGSLPTPMPYTAPGPTPQPGLDTPGRVTGDSLDAAVAAAPMPSIQHGLLPGTVGFAESSAARAIIAAANACR